MRRIYEANISLQKYKQEESISLMNIFFFSLNSKDVFSDIFRIKIKIQALVFSGNVILIIYKK